MGGRVIPIDEAAGWLADPDLANRPEEAFHEAWVRGLLEQSLRQARRRCESAGQLSHFEIFSSRYLSSGEVVPSWAEIGARHGLDSKAARGRAETVARILRGSLLEILTLESGSRRAAEMELATLGVLFHGEKE